METLFIEATGRTPMVRIDPTTGIVEFKGNSSADNSQAFYQEILNVFDRCITAGNTDITANLSLQYFNASSSKCLFNVFKRLKKVSGAGKCLTVNRLYEAHDEDMREAGYDYSALFDFDFNVLKLSAQECVKLSSQTAHS